MFHFQNKKPDKFFGLIEDNLKQVHPLFQTVFKTFLKDKEKIVNALQLPYSNAKLEATNNGSIIFVVGKSPTDLMELIFV